MIKYVDIVPGLTISLIHNINLGTSKSYWNMLGNDGYKGRDQAHRSHGQSCAVKTNLDLSSSMRLLNLLSSTSTLSLFIPSFRPFIRGIYTDSTIMIYTYFLPSVNIHHLMHLLSVLVSNVATFCPSYCSPTFKPLPAQYSMILILIAATF